MSLADTAESWLAAHYDELVGWRRHIHRYPELGRQEYATTQFIAERLVDAGLKPKVLPGIHPMVGVDAGGASLHQPAFTAAAAGPTADKAVLDGAIMLARTVVQLAESSDQRDRVLAAQSERRR